MRMPTIILQGAADLWTWAAWLWQHLGTPVEVIIGIIVFMRLWRLQGVRRLLSLITGVTELQKGSLKLLEDQVTLLKGQKALAEQQRDDFEAQFKSSEAMRDREAQGWAQALADVQREADGRRIINDQDTQIIGIYERLHGVPDEVAELIERRRAEAIRRARERAQLNAATTSSDATPRPGPGSAGD